MAKMITRMMTEEEMKELYKELWESIKHGHELTLSMRRQRWTQKNDENQKETMQEILKRNINERQSRH